MPYTAKDYSKLIGIKGFSETLLKNHFTLYQGYVTNTNKVWDALKAALADGKTATPELGCKGVTDSFVSGITRNPWNLERTPGGSSGGASAALAALAALAAGLGPLAVDAR